MRTKRVIEIDVTVCDRCGSDLPDGESPVSLKLKLGDEEVSLPDLDSKCARTIRNALVRIGVLPETNGAAKAPVTEIPARIEMPSPEEMVEQMIRDARRTELELQPAPIGFEAGASVDEDEPDFDPISDDEDAPTVHQESFL